MYFPRDRIYESWRQFIPLLHYTTFYTVLPCKRQTFLLYCQNNNWPQLHFILFLIPFFLSPGVASVDATGLGNNSIYFFKIFDFIYHWGVIFHSSVYKAIILVQWPPKCWTFQLYSVIPFNLPISLNFSTPAFFMLDTIHSLVCLFVFICHKWLKSGTFLSHRLYLNGDY